MDELRRNDLAVGIARFLAGAETEQAMLADLRDALGAGGETDDQGSLQAEKLVLMGASGIRNRDKARFDSGGLEVAVGKERSGEYDLDE